MHTGKPRPCNPMSLLSTDTEMRVPAITNSAEPALIPPAGWWVGSRKAPTKEPVTFLVGIQNRLGPSLINT